MNESETRRGESGEHTGNRVRETLQVIISPGMVTGPRWARSGVTPAPVRRAQSAERSQNRTGAAPRSPGRCCSGHLTPTRRLQRQHRSKTNQQKKRKENTVPTVGTNAVTAPLCLPGICADITSQPQPHRHCG